MKQAKNAVPDTRTINGKSLKQNLSLTAGDVKAFALGTTNTVDSINNVKWNEPSGTYITKVPGATQLLVHFNAGTGSAPALQLRANYANQGLWYRSARDNKGFEKGWAEIYTSQRKPSPAELGMYSNADIDKRINTRSGKNTAGKAVNGWWKCGDTGLIIQWGIVTPAASGPRNYPLNIPFPNKGAWALGQTYAAVSYGTDDASGSAALIDNKTIRVTLDNGLPTAWIAIGY